MLQHDTLIELKNRVLSIIETDDDGICFGLSAKFLDAFFADDLSKLAARLALFEADGDVDGLMSRIDEVIRQLADGTLETRKIKIGIRDGERAQVLSGLKEGEQVLLPANPPAPAGDGNAAAK